MEEARGLSFCNRTNYLTTDLIYFIMILLLILSQVFKYIDILVLEKQYITKYNLYRPHTMIAFIMDFRDYEYQTKTPQEPVW